MAYDRHKVIPKYQSSTHDRFDRSGQQKPLSHEEQNAIQLLESNPHMWAAFIVRIAAPMANQMFDCGMIARPPRP